MALSSYTDLIASVANWAHRSDLGALMPDIVAMAEARISRDLRLRNQITSTTLIATAGARSVPIPADWLEFENLSIITSGGSQRQLTYVPVEHMDSKYDSAYVGLPAIYTLEGDSLLLAPTPDSAYSIDAIYYARLPSIITNGTNWLLTSHPNIYLFACLAEVFLYTQNPDQIQLFSQRYSEGLQQLQVQDDRASHSGSTLRVKVI
jgi:hypothetical protein